MNLKIDLKKVKKFLKKFFTSKIARKIYLGAGLAVFLLAIIFFVFNLVYSNRIFPKTYIGGTNFGGLSRAEAENLLIDLENNSESSSLNYNYQDKSYTISLKDLQVDWKSSNAKTLDQLFAVGRSGGAGKVLREQVFAIFKSNRAFASFDYQSEKLDNFIKTIATDIDKPQKDATVAIKDNIPGVVPEEIGRRFTFETNKKIAIETIGSFNFGSKTAFIIEQINPKVIAAGAKLAIPETELYLASKLTLKAGDKTYNLDSSNLPPMIIFQANDRGELSPAIGSDKLAAFLDKIASEVNRPAQDAKFEVASGKVQTFQVSQTGYELDKSQSSALILDSLKKGEQTLELKVNVTDPKVSSDASTVGINELIGEGHTSWRGSPPNRIHNLTLGANKISGTLVEPGQEFSTIHALAPITEANGYRKELVIKNGNRVEPDIGGGLCQVSTTLFRAAIYSGLKITSRTPHSFRVSYYEPPVGMDATVFDPAPDFRFINDYSTPILIWAIAGSNTLDFQIYGTKDNRKIEISDPVTYDYVGAGEPIYTESASMGAGEIRQVERATSGASASFTYRVTAADGTVLENETFVSKYIPVPNSYLYGPGTTGIPGVEGASTQAPPSNPTPASTPTSKK